MIGDLRASLVAGSDLTENLKIVDKIEAYFFPVDEILTESKEDSLEKFFERINDSMTESWEDINANIGLMIGRELWIIEARPFTYMTCFYKAKDTYPPLDFVVKFFGKASFTSFIYAKSSFASAPGWSIEGWGYMSLSKQEMILATLKTLWEEINR